MKLHQILPRETGFDIDGVVADTMGSFISIAKRDYGIHNIIKEQITSYWLEECLPIPDEIIGEIIEKILNDPFGTGLEPLPGAVAALTEISKAGPLTFVTARPLKAPVEKWIHNTLHSVPPSRIRVIATGEHSAKVSVLQEHGIRNFVEDHLATCIQIHEAGMNAIVYDQPWNRKDPHGLPRIGSWKELLPAMELK